MGEWETKVNLYFSFIRQQMKKKNEPRKPNSAPHNSEICLLGFYSLRESSMDLVHLIIHLFPQHIHTSLCCVNDGGWDGHSPCPQGALTTDAPFSKSSLWAHVVVVGCDGHWNSYLKRNIEAWPWTGIWGNNKSTVDNPRKVRPVESINNKRYWL